MTEPYAAPSGPPPPRVPEGWKAIWNDQYKEWFYVNLHTKESTWEKPTVPASHPGDHDAPPPGYQAGTNAPMISDTKKTPLDSNNPYAAGGPGAHETDEEMARRLQREEEERQRGGHSANPGMTSDRGHSDNYYNSGPQGQNQGLQPGYTNQQPTSPGAFSPNQQQTRGSSGGGFLGKLKDKFGGQGGYSSKPGGLGGLMGGGGMGHQSYGHGGYPQQGYGGYPPQGQHGYPQQGFMQHGHGGYMQQPMMGRKKPGMGAGGAAALGVGGGLVGGMLLADAIGDHDEQVYDQGFDAGDDFGGGDMGGDF